MALNGSTFLARMTAARAFHKLVQAEWQDVGLELKGRDEFQLTKDTGKPGRADVYVLVEEIEGGKDYISFIEIKYTFWDGKPERNIRRLISRYARQLYSYTDSPDFDEHDTTLGIVFPKRPKTEGLAETIEEGFGEYGIPVVWHDVP